MISNRFEVEITERYALALEKKQMLTIEEQAHRPTVGLTGTGLDVCM